MSPAATVRRWLALISAAQLRRRYRELPLLGSPLGRRLVSFMKAGDLRHPGFSAASVLALAGVLVTAYTAIMPAARNGLQLMWLTPLAFAVCVLAFSRIISYHKGGVGLKILYAIILLRYLMLPALISATRGRLGPLMIRASAAGYWFSTAATIVELIVCCATISIAWPRVRRRQITHPPAATKGMGAGSVLTAGGVILVVLLAVVVLARGTDGVVSSFGFLLKTQRTKAATVDSYAIIAIQVMKSFLFVVAASWCAQKFRVTSKPVWVIAATAAALLNLSTYFGYNRSQILQTAIATTLTLVYLFPTFRRYVYAALLPVAGGVLLSLVALKQFGVSAFGGGLAKKVTLDALSQNLESYVNGPWPLATAYDAATAMSSHVSALTVVRSYTDNFFLFKVPGLMWPNDILHGVPSVLDLYHAATAPAQGAMLPLSGEMWFYGGQILGPVLLLAGNVFAIYLLVYVDVRSTFAVGAHRRFFYYWMASLCGLIMCYDLITIWWSFSKFAFFLAIVFWANNRAFWRTKAEVTST